MKIIKKTIVTTVFLLLCAAALLKAQPLKNTIVFSAITGTAGKTEVITLPLTVKTFTLVNGDMAFFKMIPVNKRKLQLSFIPVNGFVGVANTTLQLKNAAGKLITQIAITGLSTKGLEGKNEPPLSTIVAALGYTTNVGWETLDNNSLPIMQGEEIPAALFKKAANEKVEMIPVARYSPDFELPFGYYYNNKQMPKKQQAGVLTKAGAYPEHQILFPATVSGTNVFDPGNNTFGFYATGPTHNIYSEDVWNMLLHPANAVHAVRIYPLKDAKKNLIKNTYLLCFEEAKNGDFNDYVFIVKNITPVTDEGFTKLFNGRSLEGWHTFLKDIGTNKDPDNNFRIEDGALHVIGKDLGYAITENGYSNFHFKVDFKWGEKRWAPRDTAKRDAGICYNIPVNEPDSIWPQSIECQVQEGDVGDFWLLGFSTIKVNGIENKPSNHTRMMKYNDAEKPAGEWNTVEVISYNGKCVHIVNGVIVNVGEDASIKNGRILLQSEYAEVFYKNVMIRKL